MGIFTLAVILISVNVDAAINFKTEYDHYDEICSKKSSYEINKQACLDFEEYKKSVDPATMAIESSLNDSKMNADKLAQLINKNNDLIEKKEKQIRDNRKKIQDNKKRVQQLEQDVLNSITTMQYFSNENQIIDIVMSSINIDDLMTRIDGISNINRVNVENINEMEQTTKDLANEEANLKEDIKTLQQTKNKQKTMLLEFRRKEADLYSKISSGGSGAILNDEIDKLDLSKINEKSKRFGLPMRHGNVSATAWSYPGGGFHPGVDVANKVGTNITAPGSGALLGVSNSGGGYGKHIVIVTKKGNYVYTMIYAHLSDFVGVNGFNKGDTIAKSGNTGASTGPHVHVEVFRHNTSSVSQVVNQYKKQKDYWFGLGYSGKGDCDKVCRLEPASFFGLKLGQNY